MVVLVPLNTDILEKSTSGNLLYESHLGILRAHVESAKGAWNCVRWASIPEPADPMKPGSVILYNRAGKCAQFPNVMETDVSRGAHRYGPVGACVTYLHNSFTILTIERRWGSYLDVLRNHNRSHQDPTSAGDPERLRYDVIVSRNEQDLAGVSSQEFLKSLVPLVNELLNFSAEVTLELARRSTSGYEWCLPYAEFVCNMAQSLVGPFASKRDAQETLIAHPKAIEWLKIKIALGSAAITLRQNEQRLTRTTLAALESSSNPYLPNRIKLAE
ncbi:MAG TPA: hypothetical protein V6C81_11420 [Planktothrix sp.]|jgi:hypothetical protein